MPAAAPASPRRTLVKVLVPLVAVAALGFAFWRSVHSARAEAYTLTADTQKPWRLEVERATRPFDPVLLLVPPTDLSRELFDQLFKRSMESMRAPEIAGIPLVLEDELERAGPARLSPDALLEMARGAGLEAAPPAPHCIGHRRAPEPDPRQQIYFAIFDSPAFSAFRLNLATRLGPTFQADFLTPSLFLGLVESELGRWLPLHADAAKDCIAPLAIVPAA
jgi:hypothetical protein